MIQVNAMGDACPIPVVKTKTAIKELVGGGIVETLVDNEIAVQNLTKMANQKGYGVSSQKLAEGKYQVTMTIGENVPVEVAEDKEEVCIPDGRQKKTVVVFASDKMGSGNDELGKVLVKSFVYALTKQDQLPATIICYNGGATITCENSEALEDLKSLEAQGVEIVTCGTCLDYYGLKDQLAVGSITNMYDICEKLLEADHIVRP